MGIDGGHWERRLPAGNLATERRTPIRQVGRPAPERELSQLAGRSAGGVDRTLVLRTGTFE